MEIADVAIVYQDHHLLIVNKPANMVIHPTYKHADGTMWDAVLAYAQHQQEDWHPPVWPDDPEWTGAPLDVVEMLRKKRTERYIKENGQLARPCLLHRLDKDTSGIVALARTENARRYLIKQFHDHSMVKCYLAVVQRGAYAWAEPRATFIVTKQDSALRSVHKDFVFAAVADETYILDGPLQRDPADRRRCIVGSEGQEARTAVRVLGVEGAYALIEVHPITGRTHQIRAHLAALGYAIVGDQTYAPAADLMQPALLTRQFLHAYSLNFRRYQDQQRSTLVAPLAGDLVNWLTYAAPTLLQIYIEFNARTL